MVIRDVINEPVCLTLKLAIAYAYIQSRGSKDVTPVINKITCTNTTQWCPISLHKLDDSTIVGIYLSSLGAYAISDMGHARRSGDNR